MILGGLADLPRLRDATRRRESSWDRTGGNADMRLVAPGETLVLADMRGPGCVRHIWVTTMSREDAYLRRSVLRMFWDGARSPCVEVPLGDFFGVGHGMMVDYASLPMTMSPRDGRGFNCFLPMPFNERGRIELTNEGAAVRCWLLPRAVAPRESHRWLGQDRRRAHRRGARGVLAPPEPGRRR
jgi:hypothetical protein